MAIDEPGQGRPLDPYEDSSDNNGEIVEDTSREMVVVKPVRADIKLNTVRKRLRSLADDPHKGSAITKWKQRIRPYTERIPNPPKFEYLIYKPAGQGKFTFGYTVNDNTHISLDGVEDAVRSMYPSEFRYENQTFDPQDAFDTTPHMVRWNGAEKGVGYWMTLLGWLDEEIISESPLSRLLEGIVHYEEGVLLQVLFQPKYDWSGRGKLVKDRVEEGGLIPALTGWGGEGEGSPGSEIGEDLHDSLGRLSPKQHIDKKEASKTFNVNIRAACGSEEMANRIARSLDELSGDFYEIKGQYYGQDEQMWQRLCNREMKFGRGLNSIWRVKPNVVMGPEELLQVTTTPSLNSLPRAAKSGTAGTPESQTPLVVKDEGIFEDFDHGMTIGKGLTGRRVDEQQEDERTPTPIESVHEWKDEVNHDESLSLRAADLRHHILIAGTTGSGKSVSTVNGMLTAHKNLSGPTILIDPKGGEMCENYLRAHRAVFGDVDDVEYIKVPEEDGKVPAIPFFDLRPFVRGAGKHRHTAIENITEHFFEILRYEMGADTFDQAEMAKKILRNLIKAMFDEEYGRDYFSLTELMQAAHNYKQNGEIPRTSDPVVRDVLEQQLERDDHTFERVVGAVLNRLENLKGREFIWDMLNLTIPEEAWDPAFNWYDRDEVPIFDFRSILREDKVILIDTGELSEANQASSSMFGVLFLSHLWIAIKALGTPNDDDYVVTTLLEEAAPLARSGVVANEILPKGREFNVGLGLIMQYGKQVKEPKTHPASSEVYDEILNNINTKLIGNIKSDQRLAESLFHEDYSDDELMDRIRGLRRGEWVAQLPSTRFMGEQPEVVTVRPLPIPPGHIESENPLESREKKVRERTRARYCVSRESPYVDSGTREGADDTFHDQEQFGDEESLEYRQKAFLDQVFDALAGETEHYSIAHSMKTLEFADAADELVEMGYLNEHRIGGNKLYYEPTKKAKEEMDRTWSPSTGGERGGESIEHRIGVRLIGELWEQQGLDVTTYLTQEGKDSVFDVFGEQADEEWLCEVETSPEKGQHVRGDYRKLAVEDGRAVWVVQNRDAAKQVLKHLSEYLDDPPEWRNNVSKISDELDDPGIEQILTYSQIMDQLLE